MITPHPGQYLSINSQTYQFTSLPNLPEFIYCETGRKAQVYKVIREDREIFALKVFFPFFRSPQVLEISNLLNNLTFLPGMEAANRYVITKENSGSILANYPDLEFAVLLPWIFKDPWINIFSDHKLTFSDSARLVRSFCKVMTELERHKLAHTDISGTNVLADPREGSITLVGLESMYGPKFPKSLYISAGTPGYAHPNSAQIGQWSSDGDRFSAAVFIVEMLTVSKNRINQAAFGESFFTQTEIGERSDRFTLMCQELKEIHPRLSQLFTEAWLSKRLKDCPPIQAWNDSLSILE